MALDVQKGLTPTRKLGAGYNNGGMNIYPIANGYASNIGEGDPVKLSGGVINLATNAGAVIGVFAGCQYIDDNAQLQFKNNFVAGTSSKGGIQVGLGLSQPLAKVYDDPNQTYIVRTHLSALAATDLGKSYKVSAIGSVVGGRSQAVLDVAASVGTSGGHMITVIGLWTGQDSEFGTGPIAVEVKLSNYGIVGEL
jgi:hypothetical protein